MVSRRVVFEPRESFQFPTQTIAWYPGHMAKTRRLLIDSMKKMHFVLEVRDARIPLSSTNRDFQNILGSKKRIIILNKCDLADKSQLQVKANTLV